MEYWRGLQFLFLITLNILLNSHPSLSFKAAVFEHAQQSYRLKTKEPRDVITENLEYYRLATNFARSKGVEIIVFPEYGIFPPIDSRKELKPFLENVPNPNVTSTNPCKERDTYSDRPILYTLSCLARNNKMIIVANMGDVQPCKGEKECPKDGVFHFNTNVAFDKNGKLLAKYHKEHLFVEPAMDLPLKVQDPTFETELGRFAMFVCFDSIFKRMTDVAHWEGVKAVLLPTMWVNSQPLFNAHQYFESWAIGNNVTLLAANNQLPGMAAIGSVIANGRLGARVYTFNPDGHSKLLVTCLGDECRESNSSIFIVTKNGTEEWSHDGADVGSECSVKVLKPVQDVYTDNRCLERNIQNFTLKKLTQSYGDIELFNNGMRCLLGYTSKGIRDDFYLGVYNGTFSALDRYFFEEENCFLARCDYMDGQTCVTFPTRSKTEFFSVYLNANFSTPFVYPSVMGSGMRLIPKKLWSYETDGEQASLHFSKYAGESILTAGFKARAYDRDPPYVK